MGTAAGWDRRRATRWTYRAATLGALLLLIAALPPSSPLGVVLPLATEVVTMAVFLVAVLRKASTTRLVWWVLWSSQALVVVADLIYTYQQYHLGVTPFPGWADPFYLAAYVPELLAMYLLIAARHPRTSTAQVLDSLIIALPIIAATIVFVVVPMLTSGNWSFEAALAVVYPLLDVIVLTALIRLSVGGGHRNRSLGLLMASVALSLLSDLLYNGLSTQGLIEDMPGWLQACFTLSVILMAAAALSRDAATVQQPDPENTRHPMSRGRLIGFGLGSVALPILLATGVVTDNPASVRVVAVFAVVVNLLILWRALILLRLVADQRHALAAHARTDALTGLPNRRSWDFELDRAASWAASTGDVLTLAILDLDHFHEFNETHGHQAGDDALRDVANSWRAALPAGAYLARYGGEEFAALLPGVTGDDAHQLLDQIRLATPTPLTVSIGYAEHLHPARILDAVANADAALYSAKAAGRDLVVEAAPRSTRSRLETS
jgi:diguanylate cyclase (GGDEF)-like protein